MILTAIYWVITLIIFILIGWNFLKEEEMSKEINSMLILIPFILRILFIK